MTSLWPPRRPLRRTAAGRGRRSPCGCSRPVMRVGRGEDRRAPLAVGAQLGFVLQVDIAPPAEQDQRDVEGQRDAGDLQPRGRSSSPAMRICWKKVAAVPDQQHHRADQDRRGPTRRAARSTSARSLVRCRGGALRTLIAHTSAINAMRLNKLLSISEDFSTNPACGACDLMLVRTAGLEPARPFGQNDFKSPASTDSATSAWRRRLPRAACPADRRARRS